MPKGHTCTLYKCITPFPPFPLHAPKPIVYFIVHACRVQQNNTNTILYSHWSSIVIRDFSLTPSGRNTLSRVQSARMYFFAFRTLNVYLGINGELVSDFVSNRGFAGVMQRVARDAAIFRLKAHHAPMNACLHRINKEHKAKCVYRPEDDETDCFLQKFPNYDNIRTRLLPTNSPIRYTLCMDTALNNSNERYHTIHLPWT